MGLHVTLIHKRDVHAVEFDTTAAISDVMARAKDLCAVEGPQILFKGREVPSHAALASLTSSGENMCSSITRDTVFDTCAARRGIVLAGTATVFHVFKLPCRLYEGNKVSCHLQAGSGSKAPAAQLHARPCAVKRLHSATQARANGMNVFGLFYHCFFRVTGPCGPMSTSHPEPFHTHQC